MFTTYSKIPIKIAILLVGFGLLLAGCDSAGTTGDENDPGNTQDEEITYEVTNDLGDRISTVDGNSSSSSAKTQAKSSITFTAEQRIQPPSSITAGNPRASHLALGTRSNTSDLLFIGYKVEGSNYGGGIDIASVADSDGSLSPAGTNAAVVDGVDIQELATSNNGVENGALFAATAVDPGPFQQPPQFHAIDLTGSGNIDANNGSVNYESSLLENPDSPPPSTIAKSVVSSDPTGSNSYGAFAVSDVNSFHSISTSNNGTTIDSADVETETGAEFRSVTETASGDVYLLSDAGTIYTPFSGSPGMVEEVSLSSISSDFSIARMTSHQFSSNYSSDDFLFVALNENGFRVYNTESGEVVFSDTEVFATSVTATDEYVYVAGGDGFALYEVEDSGLQNTDLSDGLEDAGRASINDLAGSANATSAQVNHIVADGSGTNTTLYVAKSTDGVYRLEASSGNAFN